MPSAFFLLPFTNCILAYPDYLRMTQSTKASRTRVALMSYPKQQKTSPWLQRKQMVASTKCDPKKPPGWPVPA